MSVTLTLGWWVAPAALTLFTGYQWFKPVSYSYWGADFASAFVALLWTVLTLAVWLVWALLA